MTRTGPVAVPTSLDGLLPHRGRSRLIVRVISVDPEGIVCEGSPLDAPDHPLAVEGRVESGALVEYAAQAMAIHGRLCSDREAPAGIGYLIAVHDLHIGATHLDDVSGPIRVAARSVMSLGDRISYEFVTTAADGREIASGRASVALRDDESRAEAPR